MQAQLQFLAAGDLWPAAFGGAWDTAGLQSTYTGDVTVVPSVGLADVARAAARFRVPSHVFLEGGRRVVSRKGVAA